MAGEWVTNILESGEERLAVPGARLEVLRGPDAGLGVRLDAQEVLVGLRPGCGLQLTDPAVSRNHFVIELLPEGLRLRDLGSTNGTYVNGVRVVEALLDPGAQIEVGQTTLVLQALAGTVDLPLAQVEHFGPLLGRSLRMRHLFAQLERIAPTDGTILIQGETGTGKDLAAEAIHGNSLRAAGPLVVVDCGAIVEGLFESELFGHERGAFTGATEPRAGAFESANGGTVFLDEIGEVPLAMQAKLLRVIDRRTVRRLGTHEDRKADVRIIAATNRDLAAEVERGAFREDLFYRLSVLTVRMPPLRERREDIPLLVDSMLKQLTIDGVALPRDLHRRFTSYKWPGNVRELRNDVERVVAQLTPRPAPPAADAGSAPPAAALGVEVDTALPFKDMKRRVVDAHMRVYLERLLLETQGNASLAARRARIDRVYLLKLLRQYGLR